MVLIGPSTPSNLSILLPAFEPFFTTKEVGRGTGLGLAICREIVRKHKGDLVIKDAEGGGALFAITLEAMAQASPTPPFPLTTRLCPELPLPASSFLPGLGMQRPEKREVSGGPWRAESWSEI